MDLHPDIRQRQIATLGRGDLDSFRRTLLENEDWFHDLVEHSQDLLCFHDLNGRFLSMNPAPARVLGYSVNELLQIPMRDLVVPEFRDEFDAYLSKIARDGEASGLLAVTARSGERRVWRYHNSLRTKGVSSPIVRGIAHDVTEQMRTEKLLRAAGEDLLLKVQERERTITELKLFRSLLDQSNDAVELIDPETFRFLDVNEKACSDVGYTREELLSMSVFDINPSIDLSEVARVCEELKKSSSMVVEVVHRRKDGVTFPVEVSLKKVHADRDYIVAVVHDLTNRKAAESQLRLSEGRYRAVHDLSPVGICWIEASGRFLRVNPKYCEIVGRTEEDLVGRTFQSITHPDDLESNLEALRPLVVGEAQHANLQKRYLRPDGSFRWVDVSVVSMGAEADAPVWLLAIVQDITERKQAEEALRESEARERAKAAELETVLETVPVSVFIAHDVECRRVTANRWGNQQLRVPAGTNVSKSSDSGVSLGFRALRDGVEVPGDRLPMQLAAATGVPVYGAPLTIAFGDGTERYTLTNAVPMLGADGLPAGVVGASIDITERKQAEDALQERERTLRRSEENYRLFIAQSSEGIFRQDMDAPVSIDLPEDELVHHILHDSYMAECNDAIAKMYGLSSGKDILGKRLTEMLVAEDPHNIELTRDYIRSGFRVLDRESHEVDIHGNPKVFLNSMIGMVENGMLIRTWGIQRDVTEKVKLERSRQEAEEALRNSEQRFRVALKGSPIKVFNQDRELRYTWVYNLPEGWTEKDYLGKTDEEILGPEESARTVAIKRQVLETGVGNRLEFSLTAHGQTSYCDLTVEPLRDAAGAVVGVNSACVDITHLRRITDELRLAKEKLSEEKLYLEEAIGTELGFGEIVGRSPALKAVMDKVAKVAPNRATVLLLGETGTGKELVARALHRMSDRSKASFIKLNCAAIPSGLLESELFGHEKGAFTGAVSKKLGRFELADHGTLFLDEIGEIPLALQPKLLRALQDQEFERLGGTHTIKVDFRLLAATNRDLLQSVREREFRSDLYYRLNVFPIVIPPLRDRREDVPLLVEHFVRKYAARMNKSITSIPAKTMEQLVQWSWPGNIRELENFLERSVILTPGMVLQSPLGELRVQRGDDAEMTLSESERDRLLRTLRECHGQLGGPNGAAARLGLRRTTLQSRLSQLGIKPEAFRT